jgi:hypothetical protein
MPEHYVISYSSVDGLDIALRLYQTLRGTSPPTPFGWTDTTSGRVRTGTSKSSRPCVPALACCS